MLRNYARQWEAPYRVSYKVHKCSCDQLYPGVFRSHQITNMKSSRSNMAENSVLQEVKVSRKREQHMQGSGVDKWKLPVALWWSLKYVISTSWSEHTQQSTRIDTSSTQPVWLTWLYVTPAGTDSKGQVPWLNYFQFQVFGVQTTVLKMSKYDLGKMKRMNTRLKKPQQMR